MTIVSFHGARFQPEAVDSEYEAEEVELLRQLLRPGDRVIQAGVGAGFLLAMTAAHVGPENVLGYEPNAYLAQLVSENVLVNGCPLLVVPKALHVAAGTVPYSPHGEASHQLGAGLPGIWAAAHVGGAGERVPAEAIGTAVRSFGATAALLDIEGLEAKVLPVAAALPELDTLLVEVHYGAHGIELALPQEWEWTRHGTERLEGERGRYFLSCRRRAEP